MSRNDGELRLGRLEGSLRNVTIAAAVFVFLGGGATPLSAQEVASSFDQLVVLVKPGDKIAVVDAAGRETSGRIDKLSRDALILVTPAGSRQFSADDVARITQRRDDSLRNGAIIGALAGTAYFVTGAVLLSDSDGGGVIVPAAIGWGVMFAGLGAAAGAGIDALVAGKQLIYHKRPARNRVSVSPLFGQGRRGAAVTLRF
jgi:hypothetical protein